MNKLKSINLNNHYFKIKKQIFKNFSFLFKNLKIEKLNNFLFLLLFFFLPSQLGKHFFLSFSYLNGVRVDYLAPTLYLTDVLIFILFILNFSKIIFFLKNKKIILLFFLLIINILFSFNKIIGIYKLIKIIEFLILFLISAVNFQKINKKIVLITLIISSSIQLFLSIYQFVYQKSIQGIFYLLGERLFTISTIGIAKITIEGKEFLRPYGSFSHPNSLGGFFLLLYFFVLTEKKFNQHIFLKNFLLLICGMLVLLSFSKIAIFTFILLSLIYFIKNNQCLICLIGKIFILFIIGAIFLKTQTDLLTIKKRILLIINSWLMFKKYFLLGVGLGNYLIVQNQFKSRFLLFFNQPVHNIFLLFLNEVGVFIFIIITKFIYDFFKKIKINFYLILVILITGFFDHYWYTLQQNFLIFALIYGSVSSAFFTSKFKLRRTPKSFSFP